MKVLFNEAGEILACGDISGAIEIQDTFPEDFLSTFSLGKYTIINGKVKEDLTFAMPEIVDSMLIT